MVSNENRLAFFLDIDGTLIYDSFTVPEENLKAIAEARAKGHLVFINTGRSWGNIPEVLREQLEVDGYICGNGAMILYNNQIYRREKLPVSLIKRLAEYFLGCPDYWCVFEGYYGNYIISNGLRKPNDMQSVVNSMADVDEFCKKDEIQLFAMGPVPSGGFVEMFSDELDFFPIGRYADCVMKGLNKANGIERVIEIAGIKKENTVAVGDSANDLAMLRYARIGVVMKNAPPEVQEQADYITDFNYECGVAKAIRKLITEREAEK